MLSGVGAIIILILKDQKEAKKMAQRLQALAAHGSRTGLILSTHIMAHSHL